MPKHSRDRKKLAAAIEKNRERLFRSEPEQAPSLETAAA
jgi:hypothetical protein